MLQKSFQPCVELLNTHSFPRTPRTCGPWPPPHDPPSSWRRRRRRARKTHALPHRQRRWLQQQNRKPIGRTSSKELLLARIDLEKKRSSHLCGKKHPKSKKSHTLATSPLKPLPNINGKSVHFAGNGRCLGMVESSLIDSSTNVHTCAPKIWTWHVLATQNPPKKKESS